MENQGTNQMTQTTGTPNTAMLGSNTPSIEDYSVGGENDSFGFQQAKIQAQGQISNVDEALSGKSYEEQVRILAELNAPKATENFAKKEIDIFEPDLGPDGFPKKQETPPQVEEKKVDLNAELDELLAEANKKVVEKQEAKAKEIEGEEREEITDDELAVIEKTIQETKSENDRLKSLDIERQKTINVMEAQKEAYVATIEYLKGTVKDLTQKNAYYEASSEVVKSDDEHSLIQLRRGALSEGSGARDQYNYILHLADECDKMTGSNLFRKTVDQLIQESVRTDNQKFVNDYAPRNIKTEPRVDDIDQYAI